MRIKYEAEPCPHLVLEELVTPARYASLTFPDELMAAGESWGLTSSDPEYQQILRDPGWRHFHDFVRGESFVHQVLDAFAGDMRRYECRVALDHARLIDFTESRSEKELTVLDPSAEPNDVYTRLDFQSKTRGGYKDFVHLDWGRRIVGGIFFFSDADEEGLQGGELAFYRDRDFRNDRWCHDPELVTSYVPRHNTGIIFLNANSGFHGPRAITELRGRRRWLYYTISSKVDVWPCQPRQEV